MTSRCCRGDVVRKMLVIFMLVAISSAGAQDKPQPVEATTSSGDKVILHPSGRWEYVDAAKAAAAKKTFDAAPANNARQPEGQGGWLGFGRVIPPGDKDYNRGTLNPGRR